LDKLVPDKKKIISFFYRNDNNLMVTIKALYANLNSIMGNSIGFKALKIASFTINLTILPITRYRISARKT
jgi:hypothetical protein